MAPKIPYVTLPDLVLVPEDFFGGGFPPAPLAIKPFGALVALGVYLGAYGVLRLGRRRGFEDAALTSFMAHVMGLGFVLGHMLDTLMYYPARVLQDPWSLLRLWEGLSSFGGFTGALLGALVWKLRYRVPMLPYADVVASGFPLGWLFGRAGCSVAHDHPGMRSEAWWAVRYPDGGRLDLGLLECALTLVLLLAFVVLWRRPRYTGFYLAWLCMSYAPVRFLLDFFRARDLPSADARYWGLTPAQHLCLLLFAAGLGVRLAVRRHGYPHLGPQAPVGLRRLAPLEPPPPSGS